MTASRHRDDLTREPDRDPRWDREPFRGHDDVLDDDDLGELLDASPDLNVHTSSAAATGFFLGLLALVAAPFSLLLALSAGLAALALVTSVVGLARASRAVVAGTAMASSGLVLALLAGTVLGLRYLGVDTSVGDGLVPTLHGWLESLNSLLPRP